MDLSARHLNRATLARQLLLRREPFSAAEGVRSVLALQAQEAASPYLALWNRLAPFGAADLDTAFAQQAVVKATLMRVTLHAVHAEDYPALHAALRLRLRAARLGDRRFTDSGLSVAALDALLPKLAAYAAQPRSRADIERMLEAQLGVHHPGVWWALRTFAPLWHAPSGGPWTFGARPSLVAALPSPDQEEAATQPIGAQNQALQHQGVHHLIRRYLAAFGPASVADVTQFTLLTRAVARAALTALSEETRRFTGPDGAELFDLHDAPLPDEAIPAPARLLPMWDSTLLAYADRSRIVPPAYRRIVIRTNGDVLPTLLVDGYVAGVWRPVAGRVEAMAFHPLTPAAWAGLEAEAQALSGFLASRDPNAYGRYAHWWAKLPPSEVRMLG